MNIGGAIRNIRVQKGITQKSLAELAEVQQNTMSQIELGNSFPQKSTLGKICKALEISSAYLLFLSISEEDVPKDKRETFKYLKIPLEEFLKN